MKPGKLNEDQHDDARECLRKCVLFSKLDERRFETILSSTRLVSLAANEVLFEQKQHAKDIFLLRSGQIKLALLSPEGHEKIIDLIMPGTSFAEAIMFSGSKAYPVTAVALVDSEVWCIDAATYGDMLRESTDACFAVMAQMSRRLHWQIAEIDRLTLHNATFRLISYLLDQLPSTHLDSAVIRLDTPKHVIASRLSITPETLSRTFAKLSRDGCISMDDHSVRVHDIEKLRAYGHLDSL